MKIPLGPFKACRWFVDVFGRQIPGKTGSYSQSITNGLGGTIQGREQPCNNLP